MSNFRKAIDDLNNLYSEHIGYKSDKPGPNNPHSGSRFRGGNITSIKKKSKKDKEDEPSEDEIYKDTADDGETGNTIEPEYKSKDIEPNISGYKDKESQRAEDKEAAESAAIKQWVDDLNKRTEAKYAKKKIDAAKVKPGERLIDISKQVRISTSGRKLYEGDQIVVTRVYPNKKGNRFIVEFRVVDMSGKQPPPPDYSKVLGMGGSGGIETGGKKAYDADADEHGYNDVGTEEEPEIDPNAETIESRRKFIGKVMKTWLDDFM